MLYNDDDDTLCRIGRFASMIYPRITVPTEVGGCQSINPAYWQPHDTVETCKPICVACVERQTYNHIWHKVMHSTISNAVHD